MSAQATGPTAQVTAVLALHTERHYDGDGYGWSVCVEDRQAWPCATVQAIEAATCANCGGYGWTIEPEAQCGDYEHEHGEGCVVPVQVPCRCTKPPAPANLDEVPF